MPLDFMQNNLYIHKLFLWWSIYS